MKKPPSPPQWRRLMARHADALPRILTHADNPTPDGAYAHWDSLRFRPPPEGLSHEQWWLAVKLARLAQRRVLPFTDQAGNPFVYSMPDQVLAALHEIDSQASGRIALPEPVVGPETRDRYIFNSLIEEAITSSQLEGASTTRPVAVEMLRSGRKPRDRHERMIVNNFSAMREIQAGRDKPLSPGRVLELQRMLTIGTLDDPEAAGRLQRPHEQRVKVVHNASQEVLHEPPPAEQLEARLERLVRFANDVSANGECAFIHPVIRAIVLHFMLAYDHPFADGNGRTARALFYWCMLRHGYWLFEFVSISRILKAAPARYGRAFLYTETDDNDLTYFIDHQLKVIRRALAELEDYLRHKEEAIRRIEVRIKQSDLNYRQLALLSHAVRHPGHRYTTRSHRSSHNVAYATARQDLLDLASRGLLIGRKMDRKTMVFVAPADLEARLDAQPAGS